MNRLAQWMMWLYPAQWRERYGEEMDALLGDTGADARVVADLFQGALRMQFSTWSFPRLAVVLALAGMLAGVLVSLLTPPQYVARVELPLVDADSGLAKVRRLSEQIRSRTNVERVARS